MVNLSIEQLKIGCIKSFSNAREILKDAIILYKNNRWSRTVFLCQIAGEEFGKYFLLLSAMVDTMTENIAHKNKLQKRFYNHRSKTGLIAFIEDITLSKPSYSDIGSIKNVIEEYEMIKLSAMYTDFKEKYFINPSDIYNHELAKHAITIAIGRYNLTKNLKRIFTYNKIEKINKESFNSFLKSTGLIEYIQPIQ